MVCMKATSNTISQLDLDILSKELGFCDVQDEQAYETFQNGHFKSLEKFKKFELNNPSVNTQHGAFFVWSCVAANIEVVKYLSQKCDDIYYQNQKALISACSIMSLEVVKFLVHDLKFDVKKSSAEILYEVAHNSYKREDGRNIAIIQYLVSEGANIKDILDSSFSMFAPDAYMWAKKYAQACELNEKLDTELPEKSVVKKQRKI